MTGAGSTTRRWPPPDWARTIRPGAPDVPDDDRPVVIVTGASSGLGQAAAAALVRAGAVVVLAVRNRARGEQAAAACSGPGLAVVGEVDVARPASVEAFATWFAAHHDRLDLLINNAGVMAPPPTLTPEGVELQWATNHLGHFALVGRLLPLLAASPDSRVVAVSSLAAASGQLRGHDPTSLQGYGRFPSYAASKLANLVFALELDRRLRLAGLPTIAVAAHPGVTHTNLSAGVGGLAARVMAAGSRFTTQPVSQGVQPILRAATDPAVVGGQYYGPAGRRQYRGRAELLHLPASAEDHALGPELWSASVALSGVDYLSR